MCYVTFARHLCQLLRRRITTTEFFIGVRARYLVYSGWRGSQVRYWYLTPRPLANLKLGSVTIVVPRTTCVCPHTPFAKIDTQSPFLSLFGPVVFQITWVFRSRLFSATGDHFIQS